MKVMNIGRRMRGEWGNPFVIGVHGTRDQVVEYYEKWIRDRMTREPELREKIKGLHGKTLACHCAPKRCHGEVLVRLCEEVVFEDALTWVRGKR